MNNKFKFALHEGLKPEPHQTKPRRPHNQHSEDRNEDDIFTNAQQPEVQFEVAESTTL